MQYLMYVAYTVYVIAAVLMIGAILLQEGKGGGLSALGGTQAESAFGASNPIRRMTVVLSILFFLLAGFLSFMSARPSVSPGIEAPEVPAAPADKPAGEADEDTGGESTSEAVPAPVGEAGTESTPEAAPATDETEEPAPDASPDASPDAPADE